MPASDVGSLFGGAEAGKRPSRARKRASDASIDVVTLLGEIQERLRRDRERTARLQRQAAARQAATDRIWRIKTDRWLKARALLLDAVQEVDAALRPSGCALSALDESTFPHDIGSVHVRLTDFHGRGISPIMDIGVAGDGRQTVRLFELRSRPFLGLPPIHRVTREHYRVAVLKFVEFALIEKGSAPVGRCARCREPISSQREGRR